MAARYRGGGADLALAAAADRPAAPSLPPSPDNEELRRYVLALEERLEQAISHLTAANFSDEALRELRPARAVLAATDVEGHSCRLRHNAAEVAATVADANGDGECRLTVAGLALRGLPLQTAAVTAENTVLTLGGDGIEVRLVGDVTVNGAPLTT